MSTGQALSWRVRAAFVAFAVTGSLRAQTTGSIDGRVTDGAGAALAGVTVEATSPALQGARSAVTDRSGTYRFPAAPPGDYRIHAALPGFRTAQKTATVRLGATATADFTLEPAAAEQVVVSGEAPIIDRTSTTTGTSYTSAVIAQLPVSRNYADIVRSNPGVSSDRGQTEGRSLALTIYGATSAENQWVIDGVNTTNVLKGVQGKAINNEFVQEVEVKTGGYQPEYSGALGGVINVITKSGGNEFHGDAFVYYDSTGTAAQQEFKPGDSAVAQMRVADGQRYDYGAGLGGFLVRDRLWFYGAYNRITLDGHLSRFQSSENVPASAKFPFDSAENLYSGKLTWNVASSTTVVATVFADPSTTSGAAGADPRQGLGLGDVEPPVSLDPSTWYSARTQGGADYGLRLTQLFGSAVMVTLQGAYHRDNNALGAPPEVRYEDWTCAGGTPDNPCNFPPEANSVRGGYGLIVGLDDDAGSHREQAAFSVTAYRGQHEIKVGGLYMDGTTKGFGYLTGGQEVYRQNEYGQIYYAHDFIALSPDDPTPVDGRHRGAQVLDYGLYVQDSWKAGAGLTVNVGLRWDGEETRNYAGQTVMRLTDGWQPRLGVVWDPWRNGTAKVYAFAGRFSYFLPTAAVSWAFGNRVTVETYNFDPVSVIQDPNVIHHENPLFVGAAAFGDNVDKGLRAGYQDELTLGVEKLLGAGLTLGLKGTYRSLGKAIEDRCDFDYNSPQTNYTACALTNPGSGAKYASGNAPVCNGLWANADWWQCYPRGPATPPAKRIYRGIELLARESLGAQLWLQASYIYSSLRGNYDGGVNQGVYGQTTPGWNTDFDYPALWHRAYGTLALDRTNRFRLDGYWTTPFRLAVGLQFFAETGAPLNKMGYFPEGPLIFLVPRGSEGRLPTLWEANLTLAYPVALGPATMTLQAYLFNVFNKQIAISRDDSWSTSPPAGYPATIFDPNQEQTNTEYGKVTHRQDPRTFRAAVKVSF